MARNPTCIRISRIVRSARNHDRYYTDKALLPECDFPPRARLKLVVGLDSQYVRVIPSKKENQFIHDPWYSHVGADAAPHSHPHCARRTAGHASIIKAFFFKYSWIQIPHYGYGYFAVYVLVCGCGFLSEPRLLSVVSGLSKKWPPAIGGKAFVRRPAPKKRMADGERLRVGKMYRQRGIC